MKFTKRLLTIALSMGMVMPLCATAYAAPTVKNLSATITANATDSNLYDVTVTFTVEESSKQLTLLLTGPNTDGNLTDSDIVHINQFGKNVSDEANIIGSGTCTFSVSKDRMTAAGAMDETTGAIDNLYVHMNTDDAVDADNAPSAAVTQVVPVTGVTLNKTTLRLVVGGEETLEATVAPTNATDKDVTWVSSNTEVATVENGVVTAVAEGEATITVTTDDGGFTAECTVTVSPAPIPATDIELKTATELAVGRAETLTATLTPSNATSTVTWVSSDTEVATVDTNGKVTAVAVGSATITAFVDADENGVLDDGEVSATCAVTVVEAPAFIYGDVNGDTKVNRQDLLRLSKHFSGWDVELNESAADVTGDTKVNRQDLLRLSKYFSGWDVTLGPEKE